MFPRGRYYKGLGTSTSAEAKEYFSDLAQHELGFSWTGSHEAALIEKAFSKSQADQRKEWLRAYDPAVHIDHSESSLSYSDFIDRELIHFSNADNVRSIPSFVDGLKPGQRKILFACFKRGKAIMKHEIKVAQLAGCAHTPPLPLLPPPFPPPRPAPAASTVLTTRAPLGTSELSA